MLRQLAQCENATPGQVALAWLLAQKPWVVPNPGTRRVDHLQENLGALQVSFAPEELQRIDGLLARIRVHGGRMSPKYMSEVEQ